MTEPSPEALERARQIVVPHKRSDLLASIALALDAFAEEARREGAEGEREERERTFPLMDGPRIPWSALTPFETRAIKNHGQSLERLASRGGLSRLEAAAIILDLPWNMLEPIAAAIRARAPATDGEEG